MRVSRFPKHLKIHPPGMVCSNCLAKKLKPAALVNGAPGRLGLRKPGVIGRPFGRSDAALHESERNAFSSVWRDERVDHTSVIILQGVQREAWLPHWHELAWRILILSGFIWLGGATL